MSKQNLLKLIRSHKSMVHEIFLTLAKKWWIKNVKSRLENSKAIFNCAKTWCTETGKNSFQISRIIFNCQEVTNMESSENSKDIFNYSKRKKEKGGKKKTNMDNSNSTFN